MMSFPNSIHSVPLFFLAILFQFQLISYCMIENYNSNNNILCPEIEKEALLSFKQSLEDPYNLLSSWNNGSDDQVNCCKWKGVVCNNFTGHVHQLHLQNNYDPFFFDSSTHYLSGQINPSLLNLTHLRYLDLSYNNFSGTIPSFIGSLTSLEYLDLSNVGFDGTIPHTFSNITKLQHIDLSSNSINSTIPDWLYSCKDLSFISLSQNSLHGTISNAIANLSYLNTLDLSLNRDISGKIPREIGNLCKMQSLDLSDNKLQGEISDSFGNMSDCFLDSLQVLGLSGNQLSGHLTDQFGEFKSLRELHLGRNLFSGLIPTNLGKLLSLEELYLNDNKLSGNLPESLGQLFKLEDLYITNNTLEGVVTERHFVNLTKLRFLSASGNNLTLKVEPNWIPPFQLQRLYLSSWNLGVGTKKFPSWLHTQKSLEVLDLSSTGISGFLPSWVSEIYILDLSHNHLHGKIPDSLDNSWIKLSSNQFSGSLPRFGSAVYGLHLSNNSFSGDLSHFLCNHKINRTYYNRLELLYLDNNQLSGNLPDCFMEWPSLEVLSLGNNNLSGRIPNSIGFLTDLVFLNLRSNKFSGQIPLPMHKCRELVKVDLADNNLEGNIPTWIGTSLPNLRILILHSNKFIGKISSGICHLDSLQILDLSSNKFSGVLPRCVDNFTRMATKRSLDHNVYGNNYYRVYLGSASIYTKGREFQYNSILPLVNSIDLSNNNFSGDIPKELTSLVELISLNLSGNHLTGLIPDSIGDLKQLGSLDLSINSLSGGIPDSFTTMSSLGYLNLSCNNLTGRIPESTQLRTFNASSFIGNKLCGPPLTQSCSDGNEVPPPVNKEEHEGSDKSKIDWFYVFLSSGFTAGFSVVCTTLMFNKSWRDAYFGFMEDMWDEVYVFFIVKWRRLARQ